MRSKFLFPYWSRYLGILLFLVHIPFVLYKKQLGFDTPAKAVDTNLFNPHHIFFLVTTLLMSIGLFLIAFSKEKIEDEQIFQLRLDSLQWAIFVNYILLVVSLILSSDTEHILFMNLLVPLVFFIVRFRWKIYQNNRLISQDET